MFVWCSLAAAFASRSNRRRLAGSRNTAGRQHLQGDAPAERHLLGLVDDAHPAPADLAEDAEVAQVGDRRGGRDRHGQLGAGVRLGPLQLDQGGEQRPDVVGQVRVPVAVLLQRAAAPRPGGGRRTRRPVGSAARRGRRSTRPWSISLGGRLQGGEHVLEPLQGADVPLGRGRLLDPEHLGGLGVGQLLEVPQRQDLPVERVEGVERLLEPQQPLGPDGRLGRGRLLARAGGRPGRRWTRPASARGTATPRGRRPGPGPRGGPGGSWPAARRRPAAATGTAAASGRPGSRGAWRRRPRTRPGGRRTGRPGRGPGGRAGPRPSAAAGRGAGPAPRRRPRRRRPRARSTNRRSSSDSLMIADPGAIECNLPTGRRAGQEKWRNCFQTCVRRLPETHVEKILALRVQVECPAGG